MNFGARGAQSRKRQEIEELMEEVRKLGGEPHVLLPPELLNEDRHLEYLRRVVAFEKTPKESLFHQLARRSIDLPAPEGLPPGPIRRKAREVVRELARLGVYVDAGRLEPRELYADLWHDLLRDEYESLPPGAGEWRIELMPGTDPDGRRQYAKYFVKPMRDPSGGEYCHVTIKL